MKKQLELLKLLEELENLENNILLVNGLALVFNLRYSLFSMHQAYLMRIIKKCFELNASLSDEDSLKLFLKMESVVFTLKYELEKYGKADDLLQIINKLTQEHDVEIFTSKELDELVVLIIKQK